MGNTISREQLAARMDEHGTTFYVELNEDQAEDVASGYVPSDVKAQVRCMLDWQEEDRRRAERPVKTRQRKGSAAAGSASIWCIRT